MKVLCYHLTLGEIILKTIDIILGVFHCKLSMYAF